MNLISGWGLHNPANVNIFNPDSVEQLSNLILDSEKNSILARGLGRSYGDAAQLKDKSVFCLHAFDHIYLNKKEGFITVGSRVSIDSLLKKIIPEGFFIPVSPGTRNVSIGGAIASDVHGKNHHLNGSFGNHIKEILLIDGMGNLKKLSSRNNEPIEIKNQFWATIGGMGLTGVIVEATFSLLPIKTSKMITSTFKYKDLDDLMDAMVNTQDNFQYIVAWVDSLSKKNRGVLTVGNHAIESDIFKNDFRGNLLTYHSKSIASAPSFLPFRLLNKLTVKAFNEIWFRKTPKEKKDEIKSISNFFHPLDGVKDWNRFYGSKGFIQYQFVVPENEHNTIFEILEITKKIKSPSFLTVLKKFGPGNKAFLSFPMKGWTLAIDFPLSLPNLNQTLLKLDEKVLSAGGRIYLAKDSMQSSEMFKKTYPRLDEWKEVKNKMDPKNIFCSDLSKRLNIF